MQLISLLSDWQDDGLYIGKFKGEILKNCTNVNIVDIAHNIRYSNIAQAAFIIKNIYNSFPARTIHVICVNVSFDTDVLVVEHDNHIFVANDNGIFSLMFESKPKKIYRIFSTMYYSNPTFPELSIYIPILKELTSGDNIENLGHVTDNYLFKMLTNPSWEDDYIIGHVIYIDSYKNVITNIKKDFFEEIRKSRRYSIFIKSNAYKITTISNSYMDIEKGDLFAVFNFAGYLEIGQLNGKLADILSMEINSSVRINFHG